MKIEKEVKLIEAIYNTEKYGYENFELIFEGLGVDLRITDRICPIENPRGGKYKLILEFETMRESARYIEAPNYTPIGQPSVFLAGTITGTSDWQGAVAEKIFERTNATILNPRRLNFNMDANLDEEQISWEAHHLDCADLIIFWFAKETVGPITLFELGKCLNRDILVGCDPDYPRRRDLEIQLGISRPSLRLFYSLDSLTKEATIDLKRRAAK